MCDVNLDINVCIDMNIDMDIGIDIDSYYYEFLQFSFPPCFESPWSFMQKEKTIIFSSFPEVDGLGFSHMYVDSGIISFSVLIPLCCFSHL